MDHDSRRIVFASTQPAWGGGEVYLMTLAEGIRERGIEAQFVARDGGDLQRQARASGFHVLGISGKARNPIELWQLRQFLRRSSPTVVHCNDSHSLTSTGLVSATLPHVRCVSIRHTMFPIRSALKYNRLADRVICVSHAVGDACRQQGILAEKIRVVHAAIDFPQVDRSSVAKLRTQLLPSTEHQLIVAIGNLVPCKGHEVLIEAAARIKSMGLKTRTVIAGEGGQRGRLESLISELGLNDEVTLLGFRNDPNELLAAADVVAHPSFDEGLCLTVAAAMMLCKPIVTTPVSGLRDVLAMEPRMSKLGPLAAISEPGNAIDLADRLSQQLTNPPSAQRLQSAFEFATEHFTKQKMIDDTLDVYASLWPPTSQVA